MRRRHNTPSACGDPVERRAGTGSNYSANTQARDPCSLSRGISEAETEIRANVPPVYTWRLRLVGDKRFCHVSRGHTVSEASSWKRVEPTSFRRQPPPGSEAMTVTAADVTHYQNSDCVGVSQMGHQTDRLNKDSAFKHKGYQSRAVHSERSNFTDEHTRPALNSGDLLNRRRSETSTTSEIAPATPTTKHCVFLSNSDSQAVIDDRRAENTSYILSHNHQYSDHLEKYNLDLHRLPDDTAHETQLSPVTISSGYESDYNPSPTLPPEMNPAITRENSYYAYQIKADDSSKGHYSVSDAYPSVDTARFVSSSVSDTYPTSDTGSRFASKRFTSLRRHPEKRRVSSDVNSRSIDPLVLFSLRYELDIRSTKSHKQNHKLAKVARSMYEIIHDLRKQRCSLKPKQRQTSDSSSHSGDCQGSGCPRFSPISTCDMNTRGDVCLRNDNDDSEGYLKPRARADDIRVPVDPPAYPSRDLYPSLCTSRDRVTVQSPMCSSVNPIFPLNNNHGIINKTHSVQDSSERLAQPELVEANIIKNEQTGVKCIGRLDDNKTMIAMKDNNITSQKVKSVVRPHCVKVRDPQSDSEHIYETIPGDENMIHVVPHQENPKLAKWLTIPNLTGSLAKIPPALPERRYNNGSVTDISTTKTPSSSFSSSLLKTAASHNNNNSGVKQFTTTNVCSSDFVDNESDSELYAKVCKLSKDNDVSSVRVDDVDDGLYAEVIRFDRVQSGLAPSVPTSRRHVYLTDVSSENYCRLEPIQTTDDVNGWSSGDILNFIDGIHENNSPKRRENILQLLGNSKTCAKLSESLEIETRLRHKGLLFSSWDDGVYDSDIMDMMPSSTPPIVFDVCHLEPTYV